MNYQRTKLEAYNQFKSDVRTITNNLKYLSYENLRNYLFFRLEKICQ